MVLLKIKKIVNEILSTNISIKDDSDLQEFGMDSIKFVQIIIALEDEFKCEIPEEFFLMEKMNSVDKIERVISKLLEEKWNEI